MSAIKELLGLAFLSWPLVLLVLVLLAFVLAMVAGIVFARRAGRSQWRWGLMGFLAVYLLFFWDWIPTVAMHKYYCEKEAGFWIYKTLDEWKAENPGVLDTLMSNERVRSQRQGDMQSYSDTYSLNERFNWIVKHEGQFLFNRWRHEQEVVDAKTNAVLARYVDFSTSQAQRQAGWSGWKFWIDTLHCVGGQQNGSLMRRFKNKFRGAEK